MLNIEEVFDMVREELQFARTHFPPYHSAHEGYAIILEELEELKAEVFRKNRDSEKMLKEAVQVATTAIKFIKDVCDDKLG